MRRSRAVGWVLAAALGLAMPVAAAGAEGPPLTETRLLNALRLTLGEQVAVEEGKVVSRALERRLDNELAALAVVRTGAPVAAVAAVLVGGPETTREGSRGTAIRIPVTEADWQGLDFRAAELEQIRQFVSGKPGDALNLAAPEVAQLRGLTGRELEGAFRSLLMARMQAYADRGLAGVLPYVRADGESSPARELSTALDAEMPMLQERFGAVAAALTGPPRAAAGVTQRFSWSRPVIDGRDGIVLSHDVMDSSPQHVLVVQRQFFVAHTYNSLQSLTMVVPSGEGALIVQIGRTYTDRVAGPFNGMEREVGQKMILKSLGQSVRDIAAAALDQDRQASRTGRPERG